MNKHIFLVNLALAKEKYPNLIQSNIHKIDKKILL